MSLGYIQALRILHQTYGHLPLGARLHILGRFITCPFLRTLDVIPENSFVLDIGAGHGTYDRLVAEERKNVRIVAVEPDIRKTLLPIRHPSIRFVTGFDDAIRGEFDVIVVYDVIYRLPPEERDRLFKRIYDRVRPGGMFVLKDLDPGNRLKWMWNRTQEWLSDHLFGLTIGEGFYIDTREGIAERMKRAGFVNFTARDVGAGYLHAHILYTARKPA